MYRLCSLIACWTWCYGAAILRSTFQKTLIRVKHMYNELINFISSFLGALSTKTQAPTPSDDYYYYVLVKKRFYWQHAYENCLKMNGTLANLDNNDILIQLLLLMGENKEERKFKVIFAVNSFQNYLNY